MALPILKWAGGKRWLTEAISHYYDPQRRLVEPFCGGMAIALGLQPREALLNDVNPHLINFYRQVQAGEILIKDLMIHDKDAYYQNREKFNNLIKEGKYDTVEAATLFYYLNRTGFNGLCRFNQKGFFNVPFGRYKTVNYQADFRGQIPDKWSFTCDSYCDINIGENDFIYTDPPYDTEFTHYSRNGFSWQDQVEVADWLSSLDNPVIASNQGTSRIIELYTERGFTIEYIDVRRSIGASVRGKAKEILAKKNIGYHD